MTTAQKQDVVDFLKSQHEQIKSLFSQVKSAQGTEKRERFQELVRLLAVHESAEEQIVHPEARAAAGDQVVDARLHEEHEAKHALAELYDMGVDHPQFDSKLDMLAKAVIEHAEREEREEFPKLRERVSANRLQQMTEAVGAAEQMAPTRPHPKAGESATANMLAGPPLAVFDRARDAIRDRREAKQR
ncbi:MAG TPA: hemerythrin domain-containing protein [Micromonospora sp.]|nr:hemerythrin domain-containing protein [Micromonospora sp.]